MSLGGSRRQPMVDGATLVLAIGAFLSGAVIGASGPLFVVSVIVTLVAGPTWGGIALLAAIVLGAVATAWVLVGLGVGHRSYAGTAVAVACAALIAGAYVGAWYGSGARLAGWAGAHATPPPTRTWSIPPPPTFVESHADVTLRLDLGPGFASNPTSGGPEGTFGHWCESRPDTAELGGVSAMDVARLGAATVWAELLLIDPTGGSLGSVVFPRLQLQVRYDGGRSTYVYAGPVRVLASDASSGRVVFEALAGNPAPPGYPATVSGELTWACHDLAPS